MREVFLQVLNEHRYHGTTEYWGQVHEVALFDQAVIDLGEGTTDEVGQKLNVAETFGHMLVVHVTVLQVF